MSTTSIRERWSTALLRTGTELAIDQRDIDAALAAVRDRGAAYGSAYGAMEIARWVDSAILWLGWRIHPRTFSTLS